MSRLAEHLRAEGLAVWYDDNVDVGDRVTGVIEARITDACAVVVVMTPSAVKSEWVQREISYSHRRGKQLLPLMLKPCHPPILLETLHYVTVTDDNMPPASFVNLLHAACDAGALTAVMKVQTVYPQFSPGSAASTNASVTASQDSKASEHIANTLRFYGGDMWLADESSVIVTFANASRAVEAGIGLLEAMTQGHLNVSENVTYVRIVLALEESGRIDNVPPGDRATYTNETLAVLEAMESRCPLGSLVVAESVYLVAGVRRRMFRPAAAPLPRGLRAYVSYQRQRPVFTRTLLQGLTERQQNAIPPILASSWSLLSPGEEFALKDLRETLSGPLLVVLGESNLTEGEDSRVAPAATSDAVGVIEIFAALPSNKDVVVTIDCWENTSDLATDRSVVVVGSGLVNTYAFAINDLIQPLCFYKSDGDIYDRIVASGISPSGRVTKQFGSHRPSGQHCGLVILSRNPFNPSGRLVWIAGISGIGTQVAMRFVHDMLTDPGVAASVENFPDAARPIGAIVGARADRAGLNLRDYLQGRWRVSDYEILWLVDAQNRVFELQR